MTSETSKKKSLNIFIGIMVLIVGAIIGFVVWWFSRPENLDIVQSDAQMSSPSLVKVGNIDFGNEGTVRIDSSFLLDQPESVTYYLTIDVIDGFPIRAEMIDFHFTKDLNPDSLPTTSFVIQNVDSVEYPYRLDSTFEPSLWRGGVFVKRETAAIVGTVLFTVDLSVQGEEISASETTASPSVSATVSPSISAPISRASNPTNAPSHPPTPSPTFSDPLTKDAPVSQTIMPTYPSTMLPSTPLPTIAPTVAPPTPLPTFAPTPLPTATAATLPATSTELTSRLTGVRGYRVGGSITISSRTDFISGVGVVDIPVLRFQGIQVPSAPGPFLYITARPNLPSSLTGDDLRISIQAIGDGSFTLEGNFEQDFVLPDPLKIEDYEGGNWIVWCDPFGVLLGGGEISAAP